MKKIAAILLTILMSGAVQSVLATDVVPVPQSENNVKTLNDFSKFYKTSSENLLYLVLSAINEQNYSIKEIQFKTGSVLFKAYSKEFIASVSAKDGYNSFVKIIPADNNYNFSPVLIQKIHNYIELNDTVIFQKLL